MHTDKTYMMLVDQDQVQGLYGTPINAKFKLPLSWPNVDKTTQ